MTDSSKAGRVIFIGNIPYGLTEEQIVDIFSSVGNVLNFRLVYDQDTGRPKGFGFAEFADTDSAASAVRNLNGYQIMGRELRVDFSHVGGKEQQDQTHNANAPAQNPQQLPQNGYPQQQPASTALPPLPAGVDLPPNLTCPDAISTTLSKLQPPQLLDILSQMKGLVMGDPARATELLTQAPQLAYATFQALLLMGLVDTSVLASVVESQGATPNAAPPGQQPQQPPNPLPQMPPQPQQQQHNYPHQHQHQPPPPQPPYQSYPQIPGQMNVPTPPTYGQPFSQPPPQGPPQPHMQQQHQPPPPQPQAPQQPPGGGQQEELIKQVLAMTQQQVDSLPPSERAQIMALRQQLTGRY